MTDYRYDRTVYGLRKNNPLLYCFSKEASQELAGNDSTSTSMSKDMHDDIWRELNLEFLHSRGITA